MMKKIGLILYLSLVLIGCIRKTSSEEKQKIVKAWIFHNDKSSEEKIKKEFVYLEKKKENTTDIKIKEQIEKELEEWNYFIEKFKKEQLDDFFERFCYFFIKDGLREPESYKLDYVSYKKLDGDKYYIKHSFRAKNGFGGYEKKIKEYELEFKEEDFKTRLMEVVAMNKRFELTKKMMEERIEKLREMQSEYPMLFK